MITILVDHNIEGYAVLLENALSEAGWLELVSLRFVNLNEMGLAEDSSDRRVWQYAQANKMLVLTDNRNMEGEDSLEQTIRDENSVLALPVITIGDVERVAERTYREQCAGRLIEIVVYLEYYFGAGRLYIP